MSLDEGDLAGRPAVVPAGAGRPPLVPALRVVMIYAVVAAVWILFSDRAVEALAMDRAAMVRASVAKGWLFVVVTGTLLFVLVRRLQTQVAEAAAREHAAERERLQALLLLETIVETSDAAIFAKDAAGRYTLFNEAAGVFVGKAPAEVLGKDDSALFPAAQAAELQALGRRVMVEGKNITAEEHLTTPSGERVFLATKGPLRDGEGRIVGIFGISRDITERKRAEEALRQSEALFRALVEQTLAGVYVIQDGMFRYVNPAFAALFGFASAAELIDRVPTMALVAPADRQRVAEQVRNRLTGVEESARYTFHGLKADGGLLEVEIHGRAIEWQGRPAVIGMMIDITARVAAETESKRSFDELYRLNQAAVGRELDMIAMKQLINRLSQELGRPEPYPLAFLKTDTLAAGEDA